MSPENMNTCAYNNTALSSSNMYSYMQTVFTEYEYIKIHIIYTAMFSMNVITLMLIKTMYCLL